MKSNLICLDSDLPVTKSPGEGEQEHLASVAVPAWHQSRPAGGAGSVRAAPHVLVKINIAVAVNSGVALPPSLGEVWGSFSPRPDPAMAGQSSCAAGSSTVLLLCVASLSWAAPLVVVTKTDWSSENGNVDERTALGRLPVKTDGLPGLPLPHLPALPAPAAPLVPSDKSTNSAVSDEEGDAQNHTLQVNTCHLAL